MIQKPKGVLRLISLNVWGGRRIDALIAFVCKYAPITDIFCFQEVFTAKKVLRAHPEIRLDTLNSLAAALATDFHPPFFTTLLPAEEFSSSCADEAAMGNAIFVRRGIDIQSNGFSFTRFGAPYQFDGAPHRCGMVQRVRLTALTEKGVAGFTVGNFHGIATWPKIDTPERQAQIAGLCQCFLENGEQRIILCGDFNYFPENASITQFGAGKPFVNMVSRFNIETTRSDLHRTAFAYTPVVDRISDYIFATPDIKAYGLAVPAVEISDHRPLVFDFNF